MGSDQEERDEQHVEQGDDRRADQQVVAPVHSGHLTTSPDAICRSFALLALDLERELNRRDSAEPGSSSVESRSPAGLPRSTVGLFCSPAVLSAGRGAMLWAATLSGAPHPCR